MMSQGPPNLGSPNLGAPKLDKSEPVEQIDAPVDEKVENTDTIEAVPQTEKKRKYSKKDLKYYSEFIQYWSRSQKRLRNALSDFMLREMRVSVKIALTNDLFRKHLMKQMDGQIKYLLSLKDEVEKGEDPLSQMRGEDHPRKISTIVFTRLADRVEEEKLSLEEYGVKFVSTLKNVLRQKHDISQESRLCFWTMFEIGLMLEDIEGKMEEEFEAVMRVSLDYDTPYKHVLMIFLHLCLYMVKEAEQFAFDDSRVNLRPSMKKSGYSMAHWIKYRYGTTTQEKMDYDNYVDFFIRNFGLIRGRVPETRKQAYWEWLDRSFLRLEKTILSAELYRRFAKGMTIEGVIAGLIEKFEEELKRRKYNEEGKLINQPLDGESAIRFLNWLLEAAYNRKRRPNFTIQHDIRLSLDMFNFVPHVIKWENELGDRLHIDWLGLDDDVMGDE